MSENYDGPQMAQKIIRQDKEIKRTRQNNWHLCSVIMEYHQAVQAVLNFTKAYLEKGGDATKIPEKWNDLDSNRQAKYEAMVKAAGIAQ